MEQGSEFMEILRKKPLCLLDIHGLEIGEALVALNEDAVGGGNPRTERKTTTAIYSRTDGIGIKV